MKMHYRVRSVLLSQASSALTLTPVEWVRQSNPEVPAESEAAAWEDCEPTDDRAEPLEPGGKMAELRVEGQSEWVPGDFVTLTVETTEHVWVPLA